MTKLPMLSARKILKALKKVGFEIVRQPSGSHIILARPGFEDKEVTVPDYKGDIMRGTLKSILRQAELDEEEFRQLL